MGGKIASQKGLGVGLNSGEESMSLPVPTGAGTPVAPQLVCIGIMKQRPTQPSVNGPGLSCHHCELTFTSASKANRHLIGRHIEASTGTCLDCGQAFSQTKVLHRHVTNRVCVTKTQHICQHCGAPFPSRSKLAVHVSTVHLRQPKTILCEACGAVFSRRGALQRHLATFHKGSGAPARHCPLCQSAFRAVDNLQRHLVSRHANWKRWVCSLCGHKYNHSVDLKRHLKRSHAVLLPPLTGRNRKDILGVHVLPSAAGADPPGPRVAPDLDLAAKLRRLLAMVPSGEYEPDLLDFFSQLPLAKPGIRQSQPSVAEPAGVSAPPTVPTAPTVPSAPTTPPAPQPAVLISVCSLCGLAFTSPAELEAHVAVSHVAAGLTEHVPDDAAGEVGPAGGEAPADGGVHAVDAGPLLHEAHDTAVVQLLESAVAVEPPRGQHQHQQPAMLELLGAGGCMEPPLLLTSGLICLGGEQVALLSAPPLWPPALQLVAPPQRKLPIPQLPAVSRGGRGRRGRRPTGAALRLGTGVGRRTPSRAVAAAATSAADPPPLPTAAAMAEGAEARPMSMLAPDGVISQAVGRAGLNSEPVLIQMLSSGSAPLLSMVEASGGGQTALLPASIVSSLPESFTTDPLPAPLSMPVPSMAHALPDSLPVPASGSLFVSVSEPVRRHPTIVRLPPDRQTRDSPPEPVSCGMIEAGLSPQAGSAELAMVAPRHAASDGGHSGTVHSHTVHSGTAHSDTVLIGPIHSGGQPVESGASGHDVQLGEAGAALCDLIDGVSGVRGESRGGQESAGPSAVRPEMDSRPAVGSPSALGSAVCSPVAGGLAGQPKARRRRAIRPEPVEEQVAALEGVTERIVNTGGYQEASAATLENDRSTSGLSFHSDLAFTTVDPEGSDRTNINPQFADRASPEAELVEPSTGSPELSGQTTVSPELSGQTTASPELSGQTTVSAELSAQATRTSDSAVRATRSSESADRPSAGRAVGMRSWTAEPGGWKAGRGKAMLPRVLTKMTPLVAPRTLALLETALAARSEGGPVQSRFPCCVCTKVLSSKANLRSHLVSHSGETPFHCSACPKTFRYFTNARGHLRCHTAARATCDLCPRSFLLAMDLRRHRRTHLQQTRLQCPECPSQFSRADNLLRHRRQNHSGVERDTFRCNVCGKNFKTAGWLSKHNKLHSDSSDEVCQLCGARFVLRSYLNRHMKSHGQQRVYCVICPRRFINLKNLMVHRETFHRNPVPLTADELRRTSQPPPDTAPVAGRTRPAAPRLLTVHIVRTRRRRPADEHAAGEEEEEEEEALSPPTSGDSDGSDDEWRPPVGRGSAAS